VNGAGGRLFWPVGESAQGDYETLRSHVLSTGGLPGTLAAARFSRWGLAGLIAWPAAEPVFTGPVLGAIRPRWSPQEDPRLDALAAGFAWLLAAEADLTALAEGAAQ
jgi:hypothetical protein